MTRYRHNYIAVLITISCALVSGCGSSASLVHLEGVPHASISLPTLDHWMQAMAGGDFRQVIGTRGPAGLVAEPADYPRCVQAAKLVAPKTFFGQQKRTDGELERKCHELHRALKEQAMTFLIEVQWTIAEGEQHGIKVTEAEVKRAFAAARKNLYPTDADLRRYLAEHQWTLSDIFYQLKRNVIVTRLQPALQQEVARAGGGEHAFVKVALARQSDEVARTSCTPGYIVPSCSEYPKGKAEPPAPSTILEEFVQQKTRSANELGLRQPQT